MPKPFKDEKNMKKAKKWAKKGLKVREIARVMKKPASSVSNWLRY